MRRLVSAAWAGWLVNWVIGKSRFGRVLSMRSRRNRRAGGRTECVTPVIDEALMWWWSRTGNY